MAAIYKNSRAWRRDGYMTIFANGRVYLVSAGDHVYSRPVDSGRWMDATDLGDWDMLGLVSDLPADQRERILDCQANCYCDQGVGLCDFCAGVRSVGRAA